MAPAVCAALVLAVASSRADRAFADAGLPESASSELPPPYDMSMTRPVLQSSPNGKRGPDYSPEDRDAGIEGLVIVRCVLTTAGTAEGCRVIKSLSPATDREVLDWLSGCRWSPVTFQGKPVSVRYAFNFTFKPPAPTSQDGGLR
jgi:TonB family protein